MITKMIRLRINLIEKYGVQKKNLSYGMSCYDCLIPLNRVHGKWKCFKCKKTFRNIYKQKNLDYSLLINDFMTNETCRDWLKLQGKQLFVANRLLRAMELSRDGGRKLGNIMHRQFGNSRKTLNHMFKSEF